MGLLQILQRATPEITYATSVKQTQSIGCNVHSTVLALEDGTETRESQSMLQNTHAETLVLWREPLCQRLDSPTDRKVISILLCCTDGGVDEVLSRKRQHASVLRDVLTWWFDVNCQCHVYQLAVVDGLKYCDGFMNSLADFKYYSTLAKLLHILRDNARSFLMRGVGGNPKYLMGDLASKRASLQSASREGGGRSQFVNAMCSISRTRWDCDVCLHKFSLAKGSGSKQPRR